MNPVERTFSHDSLEEPPDFLTHLERRLGTSREVARKVLGDWVTSYEPVTRRSIHLQHGIDDAARAISGAHAA